MYRTLNRPCLNIIIHQVSASLVCAAFAHISCCGFSKKQAPICPPLILPVFPLILPPQEFRPDFRPDFLCASESFLADTPCKKYGRNAGGRFRTDFLSRSKKYGRRTVCRRKMPTLVVPRETFSERATSR